MSNLLAGTACYLLASVFWGLNIPLTATLLTVFDPLWLSPYRYLIASTMLGAWVLVTLGPAQLGSPIPLRRVSLLSLAVACFLVCFNIGLMLTHPVTAAAVIAGSPVYVAAVSRVMTGARLGKGFAGATVLTVIGAGIAIAGRADGQGLRLSGGEPLLVASIASWTVYSILAQRWFAPGVPQLRRTFLSSLFAIPWLLVFWMIARAAGWVGAPYLVPVGRDLAYLLVTAVFCTALATVAWNIGVARLGIAAGGLWQNAVPVFAVLNSLLFVGVVPTGTQVAGGVMVMAGVAWMQWHAFRASRGPAPAAA
ncbi:MAG: DMT family transporter [Burkholderiaceae bacterium]